jgi:hypothetical protein
MTYRHHLAELDSQDEDGATYRFTPDSIARQHWGKVRFDLSDFSHEILEPAPDSNSPRSWQDSICSALAFKLKQARGIDPSRVPEVLEFVA